MKFYIHPLNPNYSPDYNDDFHAGWLFGIWANPWPALNSSDYLYQARTLEAAQDTRRKAEEASVHLPSVECKKSALELPDNMDAWCDAASRDILTVAVACGRPVNWNWDRSQGLSCR